MTQAVQRKPIHRSAWKKNSPKLNFRFMEFYEVWVQGSRIAEPRTHGRRMPL